MSEERDIYMDDLTLEERRAKVEAAIERMYKKKGDTRTREERWNDTEKCLYYTQEEADKLIQAIEEGRCGYLVGPENDEGPVFLTKEEQIELIKQRIKS